MPARRRSGAIDNGEKPMPPDTNDSGFRLEDTGTQSTATDRPRRGRTAIIVGLIIAAAIATFFLTGIGGDGNQRADPAAGPPPAGASAPPGPSAQPTQIPQQQGSTSNIRPQPGPGNPTPPAGGAAPPGPSAGPTSIPQQSPSRVTTDTIN